MTVKPIGRRAVCGSLRKRCEIIIVGLFCVCMCLGCSQKKTSPRQVVLIVIDTLRADRLGCYGHGADISPNIDSFAGSSVLFSRAMCQAPWTQGSFASFLTGQYTSEALVRKGLRTVNGQETKRRWHGVLNPSIPTLAEKLQENGVFTSAIVGNPLINESIGLGRGFSIFEHPRNIGLLSDGQRAAGQEVSHAAALNNVGKVLGSRITDTALDLLPGIADRDFLLMLVYFDPHLPYIRHDDRYYPDGFPVSRNHQVGEIVKLRDGLAEPVHVDRELSNDFVKFKLLTESDLPGTIETKPVIDRLYNSEVRYADEQVGRFLEGLHALGIFDQTLVIITSDHGENIYDHEAYYGHGKYPYQPTTHVPLIVKWPETSPGINAAPVALMDLHQTVLDFMGTDSETVIRGGKLSPDGHRIGSPILVETTGDSQALNQGPYKFIAWDRAHILRYSLFDIDTDPGEQRDLALEFPDDTRRLQSQLDDVLQSIQPAPTAEPSAEIDPELLRKMRLLGYIE
jgi:sulfatase-like protein